MAESEFSGISPSRVALVRPTNLPQRRDGPTHWLFRRRKSAILKLATDALSRETCPLSILLVQDLASCASLLPMFFIGLTAFLL